MNLYSFSKKSWHVKFFQWLFNEDPTERYRTMCPYFWTYVVIFLCLPIILTVKIFGKWGTKFLSWIKDYKHNRERKAVAHLIKLCTNPDLTPAEAYKLKRSKCYEKYAYYELTDEIKDRVVELFWIHDAEMDKISYVARKEKREKKENFDRKYEAYKEQKWFTYLSYLITAGIAGTVLYAIGYTCYHVFGMIPWGPVGYWTGIVLLAVAILAIAVGIIFGFVKYCTIPFFEWLSCVKLPRCGICENVKKFFSFFKYLWMPIKYVFVQFFKLLGIIGGMIYATYKKQCPMITWEDETND